MKGSCLPLSLTSCMEAAHLGMPGCSIATGQTQPPAEEQLHANAPHRPDVSRLRIRRTIGRCAASLGDRGCIGDSSSGGARAAVAGRLQLFQLGQQIQGAGAWKACLHRIGPIATISLVQTLDWVQIRRGHGAGHEASADMCMVILKGRWHFRTSWTV